MTEAYERAMATSYANQKNHFTIPGSKLDKPIKNFIPGGIGSQVNGITSRIIDGGTEILFPTYYEPTLFALRLTATRFGGLQGDVMSIRGVNYKNKSVRLFPNIWQPGGANRAQNANLGPNGTIWLTRNGDRKFFVLAPPKNPELPQNTRGGKWNLSQIISAPNHDHGGNYSIDSALISNDYRWLYTVEATEDLNNWYFCQYAIDQNMGLARHQKRGIPGWLYGIGVRPGTKGFWFVTDYRSVEYAGVPHGIYCCDDGYNFELKVKVKVKEIYGNGICFLHDGSALVTLDGQSLPGYVNGRPGRISYLPNCKF